MALTGSQTLTAILLSYHQSNFHSLAFNPITGTTWTEHIILLLLGNGDGTHAVFRLENTSFWRSLVSNKGGINGYMMDDRADEKISKLSRHMPKYDDEWLDTHLYVR